MREPTLPANSLELRERWHFTFFIPGDPAPGGSKKVVTNKSKKPGARPWLIVDDAKHNAKWKGIVQLIARNRWKAPTLKGPCIVECVFYMRRPLGHFVANDARRGILKDTAPEFHTVKPDASKLRRSTEDAMSGIVYEDDSLIAKGSQEKRYCAPGEESGCIVTVRAL